MKKAIIIILTLTAAYSAHADYHYASHDGSNQYPYTSWATGAFLIQDAVDAAEPEDTIYVDSGTWNQQVLINTNNIALIGKGIDSTILETTEYLYIIGVYSDSVLIEDFSFVSNFHVRLTHGIACFNLGYLIARNNYFLGNHTGVSGNLGGLITNNYYESNNGAFNIVSIKDSLIISNNTVIHDEGPTFFTDDLYVDTSKFIIRNNLLYAHSNPGTFTQSVHPSTDTIYIHNNVFYKKIGIDGGPGVTLNYGISTNLHKFYNNTINGVYDSCSIYVRSVGVWTYYQDTLSTIDNNIFMNCDYILRNDSDIPARVRYSAIYNIAEDYFLGPGEFGEGNIFANPMITDSMDYHLQAFSPCIDAGDPNILDPDGSRSDMGAYGGPYGEAYQYLDLPPAIPDSIEAEISAGRDTIYLNWLYNTEADFNRYYLHRDTLSGFQPTMLNLIAEPDTSYFIDSDLLPYYNFYYRISAVDNQDNMSGYSEELAVIFTGTEDDFDLNYPSSAVLYQNYPNPFNQYTVINYYLPNIGVQPAEVRLEIYDLLGRSVRILVNDRQYPGQYTVSWDGRNNDGDDLPSGVYFYRLFITGIEFSKPRKLVLIK